MEFTVQEDASSLLAALRRRLPEWKSGTLRQRIDAGGVTVNGHPVRRANHPLAAGDVVGLAAEAPRPARAARTRTPQAPPAIRARLGPPPFSILHLDADVVVVDKPSGLRSVSDAREHALTVPKLLKRYLRGEGVWVVHRLDRETSGVMALARTPGAKRRLVADWDGVEKTYWAVTDGVPVPSAGRIDAPLLEGAGLFVRVSRSAEARPATTDYRTLLALGGRAWVEAHPRTGRKHQIRVHLASRGAPVAGDGRYGTGRPAPRLCLHAARLAFTHPGTGERLVFSSGYPGDFPAEFAAGPESAKR